MAEKYLAAIDVGATGIKCAYFTVDGRLAASASRPNGPHPQPGGDPAWRIWDIEEIWSKAAAALAEGKQALPQGAEFASVAVSGFGTDGAPVCRDGILLYPVISWHCTRTLPQRNRFMKTMRPEEVFEITGYHPYPANTLYRLMWFQEHKPGLLDKAERWLHIQDLINWKLSGTIATEATIASTTMALDVRKRDWSDVMLAAAGAPKRILSPIPKAVTQIGTVTAEAAQLCGLPEGTPVVTGGHDCELGVLGAGVDDPSTFIDITGTWEILIALTDHCQPTKQMYDAGLDYECHCVEGQWICQSLMIAGGVVEWIRHQFYRDIAADSDVYAKMIADAESVPAGSEGVMVLPSFIPGMGPFFASFMPGTITGLRTSSDRAHVARATWEGLVAQLALQIGAIEKATGNKAERLRVVGGGQRNPFWTQLKADVTNRVIEVSENEEPTLLGAAILGGVGSGVYASFDEALDGIDFPVQIVEPSKMHGAEYAPIMQRLAHDLPKALSSLPR